MLILYECIFLHVCILQANLLFSTLVLGSVFSDYVIFYEETNQPVQHQTSAAACRLSLPIKVSYEIPVSSSIGQEQGVWTAVNS